MKKTLSAALLVAVLSMYGCGPRSDPSPSAPAGDNPAKIDPETPKTGDGAYRPDGLQEVKPGVKPGPNTNSTPGPPPVDVGR